MLKIPIRTCPLRKSFTAQTTKIMPTIHGTQNDRLKSAALDTSDFIENSENRMVDRLLSERFDQFFDFGRGIADDATDFDAIAQRNNRWDRLDTPLRCRRRRFVDVDFCNRHAPRLFIG